MSASSTTTTTAATPNKDYHPLNNHHQHLNRKKSNSSNSINNSLNNSNSALNNGSVSSSKLRSPMIADNNGVVDQKHHTHQHQPQQQKIITNGMLMANSFRHPHQHHIHHRGNNNSSISSSSSSLNMRKSYPSSEPSNGSFSSASVAGSIQDDNMSDQCGLTQAGLEEYNSRSYYDQPVFHHQKQSSYAQSEGYHSYVSSSDSSSATPFLDRLRQETELLSRQSHHWSQNDLSPSAGSNPPNSANATIDNNSNDSTSSTETLKWLGSMSDVSVASHATNSSAISGSVSSSSQLIVHSSRVLTPKRHNSESVLYMNDDQMSVTSETSGINCSKTPNLYQLQHYHPAVSGHKTSGVDHSPNLPSISPSSGIATVSSSGSSSSASPTSISSSTIATTNPSSGSSYRSNHRLFPVGTYTEPVNGNATDYQLHHQYQPQTAQPQQHNQPMTPMKLSSPQSHNWQSVADRISDFERQKHITHHHHGLQQQQQQQQQQHLQQSQKYTYIDPSKTHRVPNPALKAFQKNAVQSYFERQQHNAKENIKNQPANQQNRPQSLQLAGAPKEVLLPLMRSSLPNNYSAAGTNFSHKSPSAQQIINNSLVISPIIDDSSPYLDCTSGVPPPPPPRSRSLMPIRRSSSASEYADFRESFIRSQEKPNLNLITSPEKMSFNDCGVPPPPPPPRGRISMPVRRTSSASEYVAFREKNIKVRQNLSKDLLGPIIMGPIISVDDWVPERPPKNPHLRIPSPDLPPPPLQVIDTDSNLLNQDEPLPPPPPEILRHIRQSSDGEIKPSSPSRRNSFAGSPSRKSLYRASTFENLSPPSVPKKPSSIDLIQPRPSSSLAQSHKAHKVILNGKLESPTSPNCPRSPSTPQPPEPMARASDPRASVRKRSHNSYAPHSTSVDSLSPGKLNIINMKSPPPLKPRMPIAGQEMRASSVAISSKLRRGVGDNQPWGDQSWNNQPSNNQPSDDQPWNNRPSNNQQSGDQHWNNQPSHNQDSGDQHWNNQPSHNQESDNQPWYNRPSNNQPEDHQHWNNQPSKNQQSGDQHWNNQASDNQQSGDQHWNNRPSHNQESDDQPWNNRPFNNQPEDHQHWNNQPSNNQQSGDQHWNNQASNNQDSGDQHWNNRPYHNQESDHQHWNNQPSNNQQSDDQPWYNRPSNNQQSGDQHWNNQASDNQQSDDQHWNNRPSHNQESDDQPWYNRPSNNQPEDHQHWNNQPSNNQQSGDQHWNNQPSHNQESGDQHWNNRPSHNQESDDQPWYNRPSNNQPEDHQHWNNQPSNNQQSGDQHWNNRPSHNQESDDQPWYNRPSNNQPEDHQHWNNQPSSNQQSGDQHWNNQASNNQQSDNQPWNNHHRHQSQNQFTDNEPSHKQPSHKQPSHNKPSKVETSPSTSQQLDSDFKELIHLIPIAKIINIALRYEQTSLSFLNTMAYLGSPQYMALCMQTIKTPEFKAIIKYLNDSGLNIKLAMNEIAKKQQVVAYSQKMDHEDAETTVNNFFMDVFNVLPKKEISDFVATKLRTSPAYKTFFTRVRAPAMYILVQDLLNAPQLASGLADLKAHGVDPREYFDLFAGVLGF